MSMSRWEMRLPQGRFLSLGDRPLVVGVINCTPDSFSDGGAYASATEAVEAALRLLSDGADWIDVGGESTRPGSMGTSVEEQIARVIDVIRRLRERTAAPISVDTMSPIVGARALEAGADIVNDVSACRDPAWRPVLEAHEVPVVLMHMRGVPLTMQEKPAYPQGVVAEVVQHLEQRMMALEAWGVSRDRVLLDPGIGFGKRTDHNLELIDGLPVLAELGRPLFIGLSRKGFIGRVAEREGLAEDLGGDRDLGTLIFNTVAILRGAHCIRVHNARYAAYAARLCRSFAPASKDRKERACHGIAP